MKLLESLIIACAMYSKIPMPRVEWNEKNMRYAMCFFPMIGMVIGALYVGWGQLWSYLAGGSLWYALMGTAIPLMVTGGIHMDGFLDVSDAKASFQTRERKLEIMKDPHMGAFAVLYGAVYLLLYIGFFSELPSSCLVYLAAVPVISRALGGLSVVWFPKAKKDGLVSEFSKTADRTPVTVCMILFLVGAAGYLWLAAGAALAILLLFGGVVLYFWYYKMSKREFGGVTGDLAGYFLQVTELVLLMVLVLYGKL